MSFYIRYVSTDDRVTTLDDLLQALQKVDPAYMKDGDLIRKGESRFGIIDITHRGDSICDGDLDLLARLATKKKHRHAILPTVENAKSMVCVQPLQSLDAKTDQVLAPLWNWLLANRAGLLVWEGGFFFNQAGELT